MTANDLVFYHSPNSRSAGTRALLEELGVPYTIHALNLTKGEQRESAYLAINPMGKVPAIMHKGALVTEQIAIYTYLADEFSAGKLAPAIGSPLRGPFLRWMAFYAACFEPALIDKSRNAEPVRASTSPYGDYDTMLKTLTDQLAKGDYILGDSFTAADVLWATGLRWTTMFKLVPESPVVMAYIERVCNRPAIVKAAELDAELAKSQSGNEKNKVA